MSVENAAPRSQGSFRGIHRFFAFFSFAAALLAVSPFLLGPGLLWAHQTFLGFEAVMSETPVQVWLATAALGVLSAWLAVLGGARWDQGSFKEGRLHLAGGLLVGLAWSVAFLATPDLEQVTLALQAMGAVPAWLTTVATFAIGVPAAFPFLGLVVAVLGLFAWLD